MTALKLDESELQFSFARSSGPGGQNVNKTNSKAVLIWMIEDSTSIPKDVKTRFLEAYGNRVNKLGEVVLSSEESRDRERNKDNCRQKLLAMLRSVWVAPKKRVKTKPKFGAVMARLDGKKKRSQVKSSRGRVSSSD